MNIGPLRQFLFKGSIGVRYFYWEAALKMFIDNPEVKERKERGCGPYLKTLYL